METYKIKVTADEVGVRLDLFISTKIDKLSRSYIQKLIKEENILINDKIQCVRKYKVQENDEICVNIPEPKKLEVLAENIDINIVYEDDDIIIVNKDKGMVVHPAPGNYSGTLVNALLYHCKTLSSINGVIRPGIVHRIDKDTSGLLVIAKNDKAHISLAEQLKEHSIKRIYNAIVFGNIDLEKGTINKPIGRHPVDRLKMAVVERNGKRAVTNYQVIRRFNNYTMIEARLETGRTHQIRVHMSYIKHPLLGDNVYGPKKQKYNTNGQVLHARTLGFIHPTTNKYIEFNSELPQYFKNIIIKLERL